ncbi:hypothetical protein pipiens_020380, partial [Culex pipiens pipiens]
MTIKVNAGTEEQIGVTVEIAEVIDEMTGGLFNGPTTTISSRSVGGSSSTFHDPTKVPLNFFENEQERWFQHATIEDVIKVRMAMGSSDIAGPSNNAMVNSSGIDKAMAMYAEIRPNQYYKFRIRKIARKLRIEAAK